MLKVLKSAVAIVFMVLISNGSFAQEEISDESLYRYAMMQEVITVMKKDISVEINRMIKSQEGMNGQRYKELSATKGDEAQLAEIEAKDWEIKFLEQTNNFKEVRINSIKTVNSELATKMVGNNGKIYKEIKSQLKADAELKARYDAIVTSLKLQEA